MLGPTLLTKRAARGGDPPVGALGGQPGALARLGGHGQLVVRLSGTEPVIRVMGEGDDKVLVEEIVDGIVNALTETA